MANQTVDTTTDHQLATIDDGVGYLTFNRPESRNAMSGEMNATLAKTLADFELDANVKCIVLTVAGKGFCAGGDVKGMASGGDSGGCRPVARARRRRALKSRLD